jgi:4-amino-4-deoxy-L-arabinose transferase-like glycosyltransferase
MRLPAAIVATLMVLFFYGLCFELQPRHDFAFLGSSVFATSMLVVQMARVNSWDIYTHAFMVGSIWMQVRAFRKTENRWLSWLLAGLLMGLSMFSKGPVAWYAMWLPFIIAYILFIDRKVLREHMKGIITMLLMALVIGFAWNAYIYLTIPDDFAAVMDKEAASRVSRHVRPFYFYFHFALYTGIWAIPMLAALFFKPVRQRIDESGKYKFLLAWVLIGLLLLSVIPEKKERYMLPLIVPMSLMVAFLFQAISDAIKGNALLRSDRNLIRIHGWIVWAIMSAMPVLAFVALKEDFASARYCVAAILSVAGSIFLFRSLLHADSASGLRNILLSSVLSVSLLTVFYLPALARMIYKPGFRDISEIGRAENYRNTPFVSAGELNMELIWRIGRAVQPFDPAKAKITPARQMIFFSYTPIEELAAPAHMEKIQSIPLGTFDCNQDIKSDCEIHVYLIEGKN